MGNGLKKLSDFVGQEHITAPLRASVMKDKPFVRLAILGDEEMAESIARAYVTSLSCENNQRGDACGECTACTAAWFSKWIYYPTKHPVQQPHARSVYYATHPIDGFISFQVKKALGDYINPDLLTLLIYAYQGTKADVMSTARNIAKTLTFEEYLEQFVLIFKNVLYLKNNLEIVDQPKLPALRALAVRLSTYQATACMRLLWDSQRKNVLSGTTNVELVSLLISEALQPTPEPEVRWEQASDSETPIKVIEDNLEQPLDLEKMLAIAHE